MILILNCEFKSQTGLGWIRVPGGGFKSQSGFWLGSSPGRWVQVLICVPARFRPLVLSVSISRVYGWCVLFLWTFSSGPLPGLVEFPSVLCNKSSFYVHQSELIHCVRAWLLETEGLAFFLVLPFPGCVIFGDVYSLFSLLF